MNLQNFINWLDGEAEKNLSWAPDAVVTHLEEGSIVSYTNEMDKRTVVAIRGDAHKVIMVDGVLV